VRFEVAVAGGGPAGLAVAIQAASRGLSTIVLERASAVPDKACGEGLMPAGVRALERLGVRDRLDPGACSPFAGIRYEQEDGAFVEARFRDGPGLGIRRTALAAALTERALEVGVVLERPCSVIGNEVRGDAHLVRTDGGTIEAGILVAADGLASPIRARAGLDVPERGRRFGIRQHFLVAPWSEHVSVHWAEGVEAYVTPAGAGRTGVAFLWDASRLPQGEKTSFASLLERFPVLAARLASAVPDSTVRGAGPLARTARRRLAPRLALVGDAAGYVDAITGEGLTLAFVSAEALGALLPRALGQGATARSLAPYERAFRRHFRRYAFFARAVLLLSRHVLVRRRALHLLAAAPWAFEAMLAFVAESEPSAR
jgi:2-polyprenyl-6-methoxyphenol hydroxylase-like FAD-dependent oxidoreductase